jgi:hypothetical protein
MQTKNNSSCNNIPEETYYGVEKHGGLDLVR